MSRRKQSKPQHVEFADDKNVAPASDPNTSTAGGVKQILLPVNAPVHEQATGQAQSAANSVQFTEANDERSAHDHTLNQPDEKTKAIENAGIIQSPDAESLMASITNDVKNGDLEQGEESAEFGDLLRGQLAASRRSLLQPRYTTRAGDNPQTEGEEDMEQGVTAGDENKVSNGETGTAELQITEKPELAIEGRQNQEEFTKEVTGEMYTCERCDAIFDVFEEFVQHEKFECEASSENDSFDNRGDQLPRNYVISGNLIMANDDDLAAEISARSSENISRNQEQDEMEQDDSTESGRMAQTMPDQLPENSQIISRKNEYMDQSESVSPDHTEETIDEHKEMSDHEDDNAADDDTNNRSQTPKDEDSSDSEKLRREIMATEAMAQAIQNMTEFASQANGTDEDKEKPDISAIKYQVRMIQQQQAYQVQMLNFLQWQLALASSNPQGPMAAATAANNRSNVMGNGFGMNQPLQPPMFLGGGGFGGNSLMPQMMAMAMNNIQGSPNDGNNLTELAKARLMMSMQAPMNENEQKFRSIYTGSQEEMMERRDQEQRYQLKETNEEEEKRQRKDSDEISDQNEKPNSVNSPTGSRQPKSDSGYDDDARSGSHGNGTVADDASSSHGSQEDGELRDGVLKATAEEHRHRCRYCHKVFGSDSALQIHIRSHTGERPFKCNICGNRFTTKGNLKVHFTRHKSKYPHIPMNNQPVPEYLDNVPTPNGVPYGMSILPEKAVLERPRLHGNPSIHINPQQSAAMSQREAPSHGAPGFFMPHLGGNKQENESAFQSERPDVGLVTGMAPADVASAIQAQLLQRRRAEYLESQWTGDVQKSPSLNDVPEMSDPKNPMSLLHAAMLPFLPGIVARQQMEAIPPHLRYLQHLHAMQAQNAANSLPDKNNNNPTMRFPTLQRSDSPPSDQAFSEKNRINALADVHKMAAARRPQLPTPSSETSKLQRLVENIDKGRTLQKNECHMCHRILSCQSALKLHYRTHTGERPYKCDLCSRAFTTRGNLRTHYSSVHRQQMRPLPPGGQGSRSSQENFSCSLCPARFREAVEFQQHMQMHAMVQARQQQQQRYLAMEQGNSRTESPSPVDLTSRMEEEKSETNEANPEVKLENKDAAFKKDAVEDTKEYNGHAKETDQDDGSVSRSSSLSEEPENVNGGMESPFVAPVKSEPSKIRTVSREEEGSVTSPAKITPPSATPLDSLAALSNLTSGNDFPQHTGSMLDHQLAALSRARAGRLTVCEICEKPFSCQSALEIHLRTHTKERPFMCKICQRAFTTKGNLKQHLLTHNITDIPDQMLMPVSSPTEGNSASTTPSTSPTPSETQKYGQKRPADMTDDNSDPAAKRAFPRHWCHICQKQFSSASSLQIHNRTHTGEKPFACNVCGRAFTTKGNLKVHMGTHVWGAGGSRRGRRISMDNPLISPWMKNMTRSRPTQPGMLPASGHVSDPAALYQQYAAIASGLLTAKQEAASRFMLPVTNGQTGNTANSASSPVSSSGSPLPSNEVTSPQNRVNGAMPSTAMNAATEWFLKAYQRTQEQVN